MSDHLNFAVRSLAELVDDQVRVVSTEVVKEDRDPENDRALKFALAVRGAEEESRYVVVVTDLWPLWIVHLELVAADVALRRVLILLLKRTYAHHRSICSELLHDCLLPLDEHVRELGQRIFPDFHHSQLIVLAES